ncbi:MAG TPA: RCC1 domain-containing protein [Trebonia sp.]|nr:RCC1 domain-containing protein [Trebonia sp.]
MWAWGGNQYGELSDGTTAGHATPERVTGLKDASIR